jgi:hypothetical protein
MRLAPIGNDTGWCRWFAWYPVSVGGERVWLEWVERRFAGFVLDDWFYCYRLPHAEAER